MGPGLTHFAFPKETSKRINTSWSVQSLKIDVSSKCRTRELGQPCGQCDASRMERRSRETCRSNCTLALLQKTLPDTAGNVSPSKVTAFLRPECTNTTAPPYRFRSADSRTHVFLVCCFCNLLLHGLRRALPVWDTHTQTHRDLEAEPRSTTYHSLWHKMVPGCLPAQRALFELTAMRPRRSQTRKN